MSKKKAEKTYLGIGAFVIARKLKDQEKTSDAGILLVGSQTALKRAEARSWDAAPCSNDRASDALRLLNELRGHDDSKFLEVLYLEQHAIPVEGDTIAIPAEAIVAIYADVEA
jgi:hypothetical protein